MTPHLPASLTRRTIALDKIQVPIPIVLGKFEYLTDEELHDHVCDIIAEYQRRVAYHTED